jgi:amino acid adenylation domain-containing protein
MSSVEIDVQAAPVAIEDAYPVSRLQAGMLFHSAYSPETAIYHDIFSFHLRADMDVEKFRSSIREIGNRHPVLRTSFDLAEFSEPLQLVHAEIEVPLEVEDLRGLTAAQQQSAIREWAQREHRQSFDFKQAPLFRVQLHRRAADTFQFSFSFHHAILDGWSVAVLLTDLFRHYLGSLRKQPVTLPPTQPEAFQQFILLEREAIESAEQRRFWEEYLDEMTVNTLARLPMEKQADQAARVVQLCVPLSPELSQGSRQLAQSMGVPLKSVLLAAHVRVMGLLCGTDDVVTGVVANGRPEEEGGDRAVGLFLNTLPQRTKLPGGTWRDLVRAVYESEQKLLPYRRFPLVEIQKSKGGRQLFETAFYFVHFHVTQTLAGVGGLECLDAEFYEETNFPLMANFSLDPQNLQVHLRLIYNPVQLSAAQVELMGHYYVAALEQMSARPAGRYETVSLLTRVEQQQIVAEWNETGAEYPPADLQELFESQVRSSPQAIALVCDGEQLSYEDLNCRANQVAWYLREQQVGPEVLVGICMDRSVEMVVGLLGVVKAGGAYLPLDPDYPADRLRYMVKDAQPVVLLTKERFQERLSDVAPARIVCLDRDHAQIGRRSIGNVPHAGSPTNLAYVIYTSGSTGLPKGVMVDRQSLANFLQSMKSEPGIRPGEALAAVTTLSFDIAGLELYLPLIAGGLIVLIGRETARDAHELHQMLIQHSVTMMQATPTMWSMLDLDGWRPRSGFKILCGAEALDKELAGKLVAHGVPAWNLYGPTETTIWSCMKRLQDSDAVTIGRPIANTRVYVLDHFQQPVPKGVSGELYVGGSGVSRGYFNRSALTAERFVPDAFGKQPGSRLYRTGDLVRFRADGELEFLGRVDQQVKIRGFRIELGEVEKALSAHEAIQQAAVSVRSGTNGEKRLVAHLVMKEQSCAEGGKDDRQTSCELREYLLQRLPEYMIPNQYVVLQAMPLTLNGKVDRKQLPEPDPSLRSQERPFIAPHTKLEQALAGIWMEVLGLEKVSANDSFFDLGGDSLLVSRMVAKIHSAFAVHIPIRTIFLTPTIQKIAAAVKAQRAKQNDQSHVEEFLDDLTDEQIEALVRETGLIVP